MSPLLLLHHPQLAFVASQDGLQIVREGGADRAAGPGHFDDVRQDAGLDEGSQMVEAGAIPFGDDAAV